MTTQINIRLCCCHLNRNLASFRRELSTIQLKKHYDILNVNSKSTVKDIKESFLRLSKIYHPDNKLTGSHNKFVELKEAYDALKNGPPKLTSDTFTARSGSYSYPNCDNYRDFRHNGSQYSSQYHRSGTSSNQQFGGPFYNSKSPWEDYKRSQQAHDTYKWQRNGYRSNGPISFTLTLSAIAWIVIFGCASLFWDIQLQRSRQINHDYQDKYLEQLKRLEKMEEDIRRRAMVKRAQRMNNYSTQQANTMANTNSKDERINPVNNFADLNETPTISINK